MLRSIFSQLGFVGGFPCEEVPCPVFRVWAVCLRFRGLLEHVALFSIDHGIVFESAGYNQRLHCYHWFNEFENLIGFECLNAL